MAGCVVLMSTVVAIAMFRMLLNSDYTKWCVLWWLQCNLIFSCFMTFSLCLL